MLLWLAWFQVYVLLSPVKALSSVAEAFSNGICNIYDATGNMSESIQIARDVHAPVEPGRAFHVRTYGCQMNVHDSEKVANLLLHAGWRSARRRRGRRPAR